MTTRAQCLCSDATAGLKGKGTGNANAKGVGLGKGKGAAKPIPHDVCKYRLNQDPCIGMSEDVIRNTEWTAVCQSRLFVVRDHSLTDRQVVPQAVIWSTLSQLILRLCGPTLLLAPPFSFSCGLQLCSVPSVTATVPQLRP